MVGDPSVKFLKHQPATGNSHRPSSIKQRRISKKVYNYKTIKLRQVENEYIDFLIESRKPIYILTL